MLLKEQYNQAALSLVENKETVNEELRDLVQKEMILVMNEGFFRRSLGALAGGVAVGWGAMKLSAQWVSQNSLPDWFTGLSRSTVSLVAGKVQEMGGGAANVGQNLVSRAPNITVGANFDWSAAGGQSLIQHLLNSEVARYTSQYAPIAMGALAGIAGAGALYTALKKLNDAFPSVDQQYKKLVSAVDARDRAAEKTARVMKKAESADTSKRDRMFKQISAAMSNVDRETKKVVREADKLESVVAKHSEVLTPPEMEMISSLLERAKSGMVSNS